MWPRVWWRCSCAWPVREAGEFILRLPIYAYGANGVLVVLLVVNGLVVASVGLYFLLRKVRSLVAREGARHSPH